MAWIESHQSLRYHPKTKRLARELKLNLPMAIGYLHMFWWWALDYAQDGNLEGYSDADIEDAVDWDRRKPNEFYQALVTAGFVDSDRTIHDWRDYAGKLIALRDKRTEAGRIGGLRSGEARREQTQSKAEANLQQTFSKRQAKRSTNQPTNPYQPTLTNQP